ncbi:MAG: hypothetical protein WAV32_01280 [Halobacteriota archaeon]
MNIPLALRIWTWQGDADGKVMLMASPTGSKTVAAANRLDVIIGNCIIV